MIKHNTHCEVLDKASEVLKEILKQKAITMSALKDIAIEFSRNIESIKKSKYEKELVQTKERNKVINYSQKIIETQMKDNNLTKEDRNRLNAFLEDITPKERKVERVKNNKSIVKTLICTSGAVSLAYIILKKNVK